MSDLPEPLVPPECDLRDYNFMPLKLERLRRSRSWLAAKRKPELGFYMLNLWAAAWHEYPAASLEDDDDMLAEFAMCDPRRWPKVREAVMRGWVKCSDGRLYHHVVAELAIDAFESKRKQRQRTAAATEARRGRSDNRNVDRYEHRDDGRDGDRDVQRNDAATVTKGEGREKEGKGQGDADRPSLDAARPSAGNGSSRYAFEGRIIRLTNEDFAAWTKTYHAITDLKAELQTIDAKFAAEPGKYRASWFQTASGWLNQRHQKLLAERTAAAPRKRGDPADADRGTWDQIRRDREAGAA